MTQASNTLDNNGSSIFNQQLANYLAHKQTSPLPFTPEEMHQFLFCLRNSMLSMRQDFAELCLNAISQRQQAEEYPFFFTRKFSEFARKACHSRHKAPPQNDIVSAFRVWAGTITGKSTAGEKQKAEQLREETRTLLTELLGNAHSAEALLQSLKRPDSPRSARFPQ